MDVITDLPAYTILENGFIHGTWFCLVADAEWEPIAVQCPDCKDRRPARLLPHRDILNRKRATEDRENYERYLMRSATSKPEVADEHRTLQ